jgi:hypothetical protein
VRRVHDITPEDAPEFIHQAKHALAPQYSEAFVDWLLERRNEQSGFFLRAREADLERRQQH